MSSQEIVREVSKNLKYYFDIRRREEGFDLSGPNSPRAEPPTTKPRPTLMYDGLHDKPVKYYFHRPQVRKTITHMRMPPGKDMQEGRMKKDLERYMAKYKFIHSFNPTYTYVPRMTGFGIPLERPKSALKGSKPARRPVSRQGISTAEAENIINMATKLLVATEMYGGKDSRPGRRKLQHSAPRSFESSIDEGLPRLNADSSNRRSPKLPKRRRMKYVYDIHGRRIPLPPKKNTDEHSDSAYSTHRMSPSSNMESEAQDDSKVPPWLRREMLKVDLPQERGVDNQWVRPHSSYESQYEQQEIIPQPPKSDATPTRPRSAKHSDQTKSSASEHTDEQVQTTGDLLKDYDQMETLLDSGPRSKYEIHVKTGSRLGASTKAAVKIALYGDHGKAPEVFLDESLAHKVPFQKGQEDHFEIECYHVGTLRKIAIGHDRKELGYGWFLEHVTVHDMKEKLTYEIPCGRWLSSREEDGRTVRHFRVDSSTNYVEESDTSSVYSEHSIHQVKVSYSPGDLPPRPLNPTHSRSESADSQSEHTSIHVNREDNQGEKEDAASGSSSSRSTYSTTSYSTYTNTNNEHSVRDTEASSVRSRKDDFFDQRHGGIDYSFVTKSVAKESEPVGTEPVILPGVKEVKEDKINVIQVKQEAKWNSVNASETEKLEGKLGNSEKQNLTSPAQNEDVVAQLENTKREPVTIDASFSKPMQVDSTPPAAGVSPNNAGVSPNNAGVSPNNAGVSPNNALNTTNQTLHTQSPHDSDRDYLTSECSDMTDTNSEYATSESSFISCNTPVSRGPSLHQAARMNDYDRVVTLVNYNKESINSADEKGLTALHLAASFGHEKLLHWLCEEGADIRMETPTGYSAIHLAAMSNHLPCLKALHAKGASLECITSTDKQSPLHLAAMGGHLDTCKWLISNDCSTSMEDSNGRTPADLAEQYQHTQVAALLHAEQQVDNESHTVTSSRYSTTSGSSYTGTTTETESTATPRVASNPSDIMRSPSNTQVVTPGDRDESTDRLASSTKQRSDGGGSDVDDSELDIRKKTSKEEEELLEKQRVYKEQQEHMSQGGVSFLDSIRNELNEDLQSTKF